MAVEANRLRTLADAVDTRYGHDEVVAALIGAVDDIIEKLEKTGRIHIQKRRQRPGKSGYRCVSWHNKSGMWQARFRRQVNGKMTNYHVGYFSNPQHASVAVEEKMLEVDRALVEERRR